MTHARTPWTPSPWVEFADRGETVSVIPAMRSGSICDIELYGPNKRANGRLIAAAPEMAEAVREAAATLTEAANCLRPQFPSLADNVIETCAARMRALLARITTPSP